MTEQIDSLEAVRSARHLAACKAKEDFYTDPESGKLVLTEFYLKGRGYCCESGCRHCPYRRK